MNKTTYTVTRFDVADDFYVEVTEENNTVNFVLCRENFGVKSFMFGLNRKEAPRKAWEDLIIKNVENYIRIFNEEFPE